MQWRAAAHALHLLLGMTARPPVPPRRLQDVLWDRRSLYLVMEQLSCDLKEHLDANPAAWQLPAVKVRARTA